MNRMPIPTPPVRIEGQPAWLVTYADLVSLLLCFFVMFYAMSTIEVGKWRQIARGLAADRPVATGATVGIIGPPVRTVVRGLTGSDARPGAEVEYLAVVIGRRIDDEAALAQAIVTRLEDRLVISLPGDLLFSDRGITLDPRGRAAAAALGAVLGNLRNQVDVQGHADAMAGRSASDRAAVAANWEVSLARAIAVAEELKRGGYGREMAILGLADTRHADLSAHLSEAERRRLARRVDVIVRPIRAEARRS